MDIMKISDPCVTLTLVANTSNRVAIPSNSAFIVVYNPADTVTYVKTGGASVTAAATGTFIPPKATFSFKKDNESYIAGFNATEGVVLNIQTGNGI